MFIALPILDTLQKIAKNDKFLAGEHRYSRRKRLVRISLYPCKIDRVMGIISWSIIMFIGCQL